MRFDEWRKTVPEEIVNDALWSVEAYRLGLFAGDLGWSDVTKLLSDRRTLRLSDQLYRSLGSISTNISEGYSRGSGKDRARFYPPASQSSWRAGEYALGSARESRDWYYKGRHILGNEVVLHRIRLLTHIIRLLLTMIPDQRSYKVSEPQKQYEIVITELLEDIPLP